MRLLKPEYLLDAARLWGRQPLQAGLSMAGIVIGVAGLVVATGLGEGARLEIQAVAQRLGAGTMIVRSGGQPGEHGIPSERAAALSRLLAEDIETMTPVVQTKSRVTGGGREVGGATILGTDASYGPSAGLALRQGRFLTWYDVERGEAVCVLSWKLARLLYPAGNAVGKRVRIGRGWHEVVGILSPGLGESKELRAGEGRSVELTGIVPVSTLGSRRHPPELSELRLRFVDETRMLRAVPAVQRIVEHGQGERRYQYLIPVDMLRQKYRMQTVTGGLLNGMTVVLLAVAGIGIMNVMSMNVIRRREEVGLRRAFGATRDDILAQFLIESTSLSFAGGLLGTAAGLIAGSAISVLSAWPVALTAPAILAGLGASMLVGILAGTLPAYRASGISPVRSLAGA